MRIFSYTNKGYRKKTDGSIYRAGISVIENRLNTININKKINVEQFSLLTSLIVLRVYSFPA